MLKGSAGLYQRFAKTLNSLGPFESEPIIAVAVSGGVDSLALTFLTHQWIKNNGGTLIALHVDHRLRDTATEEATQVKTWLHAKEISCTILPWVHDGITSAIQEQARDARYDLLTTYCKNQGIFHLFLGHHKEDQEETFFHRQSKGSGAEGLAGMSILEEGPHVRLVRPLLNISKSDLQTFLGDHPFINDPSNTNEKFWRAQFRKNPKQGYSESFGDKRIQLEQTLARLLAEHAAVYPEGYATLSKDFQNDASPFLQEKILGKILTTIGGHTYPVRTSVVAHLLNHLPTESWVSAGGCLIRLKGNIYQIIREWGRIQDTRLINTPNPFLWDGRFTVTPPSSPLTCKPLGEDGWRQIKDQLTKKILPAQVFYALPAFFDEKGFFVSLANAAFTPKNRLLRGMWRSA